MKQLAGLALLVAAGSALAAEGTLPLRAGDEVRGTLVRCGDRHIFETELVRGETFKVRVELADPSAPPELRVFDSAGNDLTHFARVHASGGLLVAGPVRAPSSGVFVVTLSSTAAHELRYDMKTTVGRAPKHDVRLPKNGRAATVPAAAGSTIALRTKNGATPAVSLVVPGEEPRELAAGDPMLAALLGAGLAAPSSGDYSFTLPRGSKARLTVTPPVAVKPVASDFPALPDDEPAVAWYVSSGWVSTPPAGAPPVEPSPTWSSALTQLTASPAVPDPSAAATPDLWLGPASGIGMPLAGAPSLAEIVASGVPEDTTTGRGYVLTVPRAGIGPVTYRVSFVVDGHPAAAPVSLTGRVSMSWSVRSATPSHVGAWTLTFDPQRNAQILDGAESMTDGTARTVASAARGFVLPLGAAGPSGTLTWNVTDPRNGVSLVRRETYDGTDTVRVQTGPTLAAATTFSVVAH